LYINLDVRREVEQITATTDIDFAVLKQLQWPWAKNKKFSNYCYYTTFNLTEHSFKYVASKYIFENK
jgi:hypothetical protein